MVMTPNTFAMHVDEFLRELKKVPMFIHQRCQLNGIQWRGDYLDNFPIPSPPIIYPLLVGNEASTRKNLLLRKSLINATGGVLSGRALLCLLKELTFWCDSGSQLSK